MKVEENGVHVTSAQILNCLIQEQFDWNLVENAIIFYEPFTYTSL